MLWSVKAFCLPGVRIVVLTDLSLHAPLVFAELLDDKAWGQKRKQFYGADVDADIGQSRDVLRFSRWDL